MFKHIYLDPVFLFLFSMYCTLCSDIDFKPNNYHLRNIICQPYLANMPRPTKNQVIRVEQLTTIDTLCGYGGLE